ncbi:MAG: hypothetical protein FJY29_10860 [Betaproteobacteria bacterium]|nr:hypothetical protein [Betaproteobacteria bacterium]
MSSEFPMSFPEESQLASLQPQRKSEKKRVQHSERTSSADRKSSNRKNVIPLSRHADSMLAPMSEMAAAPANNASGMGDYPLSEFSSEEGTTHSSKPRTGRRVLRSVLGLTLVGLWVAIATGHLHSELPLMEQLRSQLSLSEHSAAETSADQNATLQAPSVPEVVAGDSAVVTNATMSSTEPTAQTALEKNSSSADAGAPAASQPTSAASIFGEGNLPATPAALNAQGAAQPMRVPPIPGSVSSADVEKTAKLFLTQGAQLNALEEHLAQLLLQHGSAEKLDSLLDSMERRHKDALETIQALRSRGKNSKQ